MLAYAFWHWHGPEIDAHTYQDYLVNFHRTLYEHKPRGFHHTRVLMLQQAPWLQRNGRTYEDWHLVDDSAALDPLNEQAISGPCLAPHRQVARWTRGSAGGLYRLALGEDSLPEVRFAYHFSKPDGITYSELYEVLQQLMEKVKGTLWMRQMSLGPAAEFCFHSTEAINFLAILPTLMIPVKQICFTHDGR